MELASLSRLMLPLGEVAADELLMALTGVGSGLPAGDKHMEVDTDPVSLQLPPREE